jgi:hypothetical protein
MTTSHTDTTDSILPLDGGAIHMCQHGPRDAPALLHQRGGVLWPTGDLTGETAT